MKRYLVEKVIREFIESKDILEQNLIQIMDEIILQSKDRYGTVTLTIKYERNDKFETNNN